MAARISKHLGLLLYCYSRQAERSVHYAASCPSQWANFVAYYDSPKRFRIVDLLNQLKAAGCAPAASIRPRTEETILSLVPLVFRMIVNPVRQSWQFRADELWLCAEAFEHLLGMLNPEAIPATDSLLNLRRAFLECSRMIERKMIGLPEIADASRIEHWFQSHYGKFVTLADLGLPPE